MLNNDNFTKLTANLTKSIKRKIQRAFEKLKVRLVKMSKIKFNRQVLQQVNYME